MAVFSAQCSSFTGLASRLNDISAALPGSHGNTIPGVTSRYSACERTGTSVLEEKEPIYYQARDSETWRLKYPLKQPYVFYEHYATVLLTSRSRSRNDASLKGSGGALMASFIYRRDAAATHDAIKHPEWTLIIPQLLLGPLHFMILTLSSSPLLRTC